ncbi:MAG: PEP-CTERM sorting domain-containing protein [Candidatus Omnitrophica bacterium]|nr:hypothetical protein [bacterium]NUN96288.1 PEP-CTERM sorting domain-containing protein [Candidatus Omnitrophota bacterium]
MRNLVAAITIFASMLFAVEGNALSISDSELSGLSFTYTNDSLTDTAGSRTFQVFGMGTAIANGFLYVVIQTNFPQSGAMGNDSYTGTTHFSPGDLYLNVGGTFQNGGGSVYGVGTTNHANVVQQAYMGETWINVVAGSLYSNAGFATGTYEQYQRNNPSFDPNDGDGNNRLNSYPTLLRSGNLVAGDVSGLRFRNNTTDAWDFDIFYKVSLAALGLIGGESIQAFWTMECGNDGVQQIIGNPVIPEPTTIGLLLAGVSALAVRRRRTA